MVRRQFPFVGSALILVACGGSNAPSVVPLAPNEAPAIQVPSTLAGTSPTYDYVLPFEAVDQLVFEATDPEGGALAWQVIGDVAAVGAVAIAAPSSTAGGSLTMTFSSLTAPVAVGMTILVEDPRGGAAAIDLRVVRSGPPTLISATPDSAFLTQPQTVQLVGSGFRLGPAPNTRFRFAGQPIVAPTITSDSRASFVTPSLAVLGPTAVGVANQFGIAALPVGSFSMHAWPVDLFATDARIDAGAASEVELARDGAAAHAVWLEGPALVHRVSPDRGRTWAPPVTLSGPEAVSEPQLLVDGDLVLAGWIGDGTAVWVRRSIDGGATWEPAVRGSGPISTTPVSKVRLAQSGDHRHVAWLAGNVIAGEGRVMAIASTTAGATWTAPNPVASAVGNQRSVAIVCSDNFVWVLYEQDLPGRPRGAYVARSFDAGSTWPEVLRLSPLTAEVSEAALCTDGMRVHATWLQNGGLALASSPDRGASWGDTIIDLQTAQAGTVTAPHVTCDERRLVAAFVVGGTSVRTATFTPAGVSLQRATIELQPTRSDQPRIAVSGNYAFVVWREGEVAQGTARLAFAASPTDGIWTSPSSFGDGNSVQTAPRLAASGAHLLFAWGDSRAATTGVFVNSTEN
ncbi:MAG: exo-alpha-sialidase [Planctomycetes bacterium]|jgi:hypothetical protein|nr:exo-alpha-sialidase [Planctomycetota bacterium]